ncbi:MAG: transcriptional repressor [Deltaproteobacteria bacterium RIFOXYD12_FULL_57_12]|nr:MAG: transcriptional repressor [Deltaproteobacteria bacterium RIFOXYD12_FULL_57_12]
MENLPNTMRITSQRQVILDELRKVTSHPTASEVYDMVRKRLPRIGLGTVYRNLELLTEHELIRKLKVGGEQKRFDGNAAPHYHVRCVQCGRVDDVEINPLLDLEQKVATCSGYEILGHHVEFEGRCAACKTTS